MTNLHDARVAAAIESAWNKSHEFRGAGGQTIYSPPWEFQQIIKAAIAAADAAVTVEMIADEIAGHPIGGGYYQTTVGTGEAREIARALLALIRGETETSE